MKETDCERTGFRDATSSDPRDSYYVYIGCIYMSYQDTTHPGAAYYAACANSPSGG